MRIYDYDAATRADPLDCFRQSSFSFAIEIRIGLIRNDDERVAVERARQGQTLPLTG